MRTRKNPTPPAWLRSLRFTLLLIGIVTAFFFSIRVTQPDFVKLVTSSSKAKDILSQLLSPDLVTREAGLYRVEAVFPVPCGSAENAPIPESGPRIIPQPGCAAERETFLLHGYELEANTDVAVIWKLPDGNELTAVRTQTDSKGYFEVEVQARPIVAAVNGQPSVLMAEVTQQSTRIRPSDTVKEVVDQMMVTIFMALLATTIGTILAIPMGFLAASNITRRGVIGTAVYYIIRTFLNILRSIESLVTATIFALIVGFGSPYAGVLALVLITTASLGKMFSEAVESIDTGPIEALTATGASRTEVILYAVVPQIVPDFLSFTIYHWDINVRISTIIGFVGGGGIGYYLSQKINTFGYSQAGTALLAIILVVWVLDFLSSLIRKKLI